MNHKEIVSVSGIKQLCTKYGLKPSKRFGQNYLISEGPVQKILSTVAANTTPYLLEVGPGFGILTLNVAQDFKHVVAFEIEKTLAPYWEEIITTYPNIHIEWGDVLKNFPKWVAAHPTDTYQVAANLPYHIAAHIIRMFLESSNQPTQMVCMVQKEVAERMNAQAGDMNLLALSVQLFSTVEIIQTVKAGSFWPAPHVDSAIVFLKNIHAPLAHKEFFTIARAGFRFKRKMLSKNLQSVLTCSREEIEEHIAEVSGGNMSARPQDLSCDAWARLVEKLLPYLSTAQS